MQVNIIIVYSHLKKLFNLRISRNQIINNFKNNNSNNNKKIRKLIFHPTWIKVRKVRMSSNKKNIWFYINWNCNNSNKMLHFQKVTYPLNLIAMNASIKIIWKKIKVIKIKLIIIVQLNIKKWLMKGII